MCVSVAAAVVVVVVVVVVVMLLLLLLFYRNDTNLSLCRSVMARLLSSLRPKIYLFQENAPSSVASPAQIII